MDISHSETINSNECNKNKFSDLYKACLENDIDLVQSLLATSSFEMINCHEMNGDTALHVAVKCGHTEIVRLLLHDYGVCRHLLDSQGCIAFELAQTDAIRQLFQRLTTDRNRFYNETIFSPEFTDDESDEKKNSSCRRVEGHENHGSILNEPVHMRYRSPGGLFRRLTDKLTPYKSGSDQFILKTSSILSDLVDQQIGASDKQYHKAKMLVKQYYESGRVDSLLRLYTLETPFYTYINQKKENSECLAAAIYYSLRFLRQRAFRGICYRGLSMTTEELKDYQWAAGKTSRYLVINTFCSSTKDMIFAQKIAEIRATNQRDPVVIAFDFYSTCFRAIQLEKLSDQLPSISEMEGEQEVLILPRTTFRVTKVEQGLPNATIYLTYYPHDREIDDWTDILAQNVSEY